MTMRRMNPLLSMLKGRGTANLLRRAGLIVAPQVGADGRYSGVRLQWEQDEPDILRGTVVKAQIRGRSVRFFIVNELDEVQGKHRRGEFYEEEELAIIANHFSGGTFVDVGANVGNHSLFALLFLGAAKVIAFEPLPEAAKLIELNIALNGLQEKFRLHRQGLSDSASFAQVNTDPSKIDNLGGTRLSVTNSETGIELVAGDDVLHEKVDFIKIDTEGFELPVLRGLRNTIDQHKPSLFVEVENENRPEFEAMMAQMGYRIAEEFRRYRENVNLLAVPIARPSSSA